GSAPAAKEQMAAQHGQAAGGPEDAPDVKVPKADGANAKTVSELWAQRAALKGKEVSVKAKVVKITAGVMGRNWLHVRDGSGSKATKDNDLTVTTDANAKVGDVVTLSGTVSVDKDFGAGYTYPVIVENAKLK
ncbi:MAG TPA: OB-fold nucleic acid binding domain-containing protein, partial [Thermoanaerobaculia bacterium]|nr:OB-fold nucleic acid binding domain-containing protein [Thermoanaerobaculia bacterium]